jgi:hypothetical protein
VVQKPVKDQPETWGHVGRNDIAAFIPGKPEEITAYVGKLKNPPVQNLGDLDKGLQAISLVGPNNKAVWTGGGANAFVEVLKGKKGVLGQVQLAETMHNGLISALENWVERLTDCQALGGQALKEGVEAYEYWNSNPELQHTNLGIAKKNEMNTALTQLDRQITQSVADAKSFAGYIHRAADGQTFWIEGDQQAADTGRWDAYGKHVAAQPVPPADTGGHDDDGGGEPDRDDDGEPDKSDRDDHYTSDGQPDRDDDGEPDATDKDDGWTPDGKHDRDNDETGDTDELPE